LRCVPRYRRADLSQLLGPGTCSTQQVQCLIRQQKKVLRYRRADVSQLLGPGTHSTQQVQCLIRQQKKVLRYRRADLSQSAQLLSVAEVRDGFLGGGMLPDQATVVGGVADRADLCLRCRGQGPVVSLLCTTLQRDFILGNSLWHKCSPQGSLHMSRELCSEQLPLTQRHSARIITYVLLGALLWAIAFDARALRKITDVLQRALLSIIGEHSSWSSHHQAFRQVRVIW
jgi:hypothetical protein